MNPARVLASVDLDGRTVMSQLPMFGCVHLQQIYQILTTPRHKANHAQHIPLKSYWLAKQEPSGPRGYSFEALKRDKKTVWDGVHNNLALKHMRNMKPGDLVLFYHTGDEKQAVGIMEVASKPYPNPEEDNERFIVVDVKYKKPLKRPVRLEEMKGRPGFQDWELVRISRLSVMPVPKEIWDEIISISQSQAA